MVELNLLSGNRCCTIQIESDADPYNNIRQHQKIRSRYSVRPKIGGSDWPEASNELLELEKEPNFSHPHSKMLRYEEPFPDLVG